MEEIILENRNLIYSITKYFERYPNKEDLFQAGCIGLISAYKNYDKTLNVKFTTYAYPFILGEMRKLAREDRTIKVSRTIQRLNLKIEKARLILTQKLMREPSIEELSHFLEIPEFMVSDAINSTKSVYSIDASIDDFKPLHEVVGKEVNVDDLIMLKDALSKLDKNEKDLINKRFINDLTQKETADLMGISQVQVSRKEQKILTKLKSKLTC